MLNFLLFFAIYFAAVFLVKSDLVYYTKFLLYHLWVIVCTTLFIPIAALRPGNVENLNLISKALKLVRSFCGLRYEFKGEENVKSEESCVLVANHQSSLDLLGMYEHWDHFGKMAPIAKRELMYAGPFGLFCYLAGIIFVRRNTGAKAGQEMNETMMRLKDEDTKLWVFPEGTRRNTGQIHQFKKGAFHAAIHAQVPIVPVVFSSYKMFLNDEKKIFADGEIIIEVLPGISTTEMTLEDVDSLIEQTKSAMNKTYNANSTYVAKKAIFR